MPRRLQADVTQTVEIVEARQADIPLIIALAQRIWPVAYAGILTPEQIANMLERIYSVAGLQAEMSAGHCFWIAYDSMDAVGFASAYREDAAVIWLKKIYVDPARQGQGVGKQLIRTAMHAFGAARELRLLVNPNNLPGQRYYEYQHFIRIGEKPVMMGDWAFNDFIYSKPITD